jgi:lipoprotein-anchoring transpeptidase ErfK/SrfK
MPRWWRLGVREECRAVVVGILGFLCATVCLGLVPAVAVGLELHGPRDVFERGTFVVIVAPGEPTGTVALSVDGARTATLTCDPGADVVFSGLAIGLGRHRVSAVLVDEMGDIRARSAPIDVRAWSRPGQPRVLSPVSGALTGRLMDVTVRVQADTTLVSLIADGRVVRTRAVASGGVARFSDVPVTRSRLTLRVVASNPVTTTPSPAVVVRRFTYPRGWSTCIVIDKSEYRLYWIRSDHLIKWYPIAHGRHNWTPEIVWRVDAKYVTGGIYGPRKMRLFRRTPSGRYVFTRYGIHGTNQPWVIGTQASHGCIRMYNKDVLDLWPQVPLHTLVQTRA